MDKKIMTTVRVGLTGCALAATLTGCGLFGCGNDCSGNAADCGKKTSGVNAGVSLGIGTDGIRAGTTGNVGSHGMSADVGGSVH